MAYFSGESAARLYRPSLQRSELHSAQVAKNTNRANPLLLMARLCLESAFRDCLKLESDGRPSEDAVNAMTWIRDDLDWTAVPLQRRIEAWGAPAPPPHIREEFCFSFQFCCRVLELDPQEIRNNGIRHIAGFSHRSNRWLSELHGIRAHWARAKEEYEERMAQQPREQPQGTMEISA